MLSRQRQELSLPGCLWLIFPAARIGCWQWESARSVCQLDEGQLANRGQILWRLDCGSKSCPLRVA